MDSIEQKLNNLGNKILTVSKNELYISMRFLDMALGGLDFESDEALEEAAVDGRKLYFNPKSIIKKYSADSQEINRIYVHCLLHCIFRHFLNGKEKITKYWNLACDIAVEHAADNLSPLKKKISPEKKKIYSFMENRMKTLSAEGIYNVLCEFKITGNDYDVMTREFHVDSHRYWAGTSEGKKDDSESSRTKKSDDVDGSNAFENDNSSGRSGDSSSEGSGGRKSAGDEDGGNNNKNKGDDFQNSDNENSNEAPYSREEELLYEKWKNISERIKINMETMSDYDKLDTKSIAKNIDIENRERYDYGDFLRKFAVEKEEIKVDNDSFDYIFYTYGTKLYKNMPLIEPLEYKDSIKIDEFAVVIDTSASCDGDKVKDFLKTTFEILKNSETFFRKVKIHIIQCDEKVREDKVINDIEEGEKYIKNFKAKGFNGTDFRPAFEYIDSLKSKNFNLRGLIYFTDGMGTYPVKAPSYDTAFVFLRDSDYSDADVPPWAMKIIIDKIKN